MRAVCLLVLSLSTGGARAQGAPQEDLADVRVSGLLHFDAALWNEGSVDELDPATREPLNEDRFVLRRARLRADVERNLARGYLALDANSVHGATLRVLAAEAGLGYPSARTEVAAAWSAYAGVGLFLIPFGYETQEAAAARMFLEPSQWVRALFPGRRDLGARASGRWSFLRIELAATNGEPSGSDAFSLRDPNAAKDFTGRISVQGELLRGLHGRLGSSLLLGTGFHAGRAQSKDALVWRDANEDGIVQTTELQIIAGVPAEASANFARYALGAECELSAELALLGRLRIYGEVALAENADRGLWRADPIATGRDQRELGFMIGVRQQLTRHVELGARYDHYEPDLDHNDSQGARIVPVDSTFSTLALAIAWTTLAGVRVTLEYDRNRNPLGRSAGGQPTTLASDVLTLRGQLEL